MTKAELRLLMLVGISQSDGTLIIKNKTGLWLWRKCGENVFKQGRWIAKISVPDSCSSILPSSDRKCFQSVFGIP